MERQARAGLSASQASRAGTFGTSSRPLAWLNLQRRRLRRWVMSAATTLSALGPTAPELLGVTNDRASRVDSG